MTQTERSRNAPGKAHRKGLSLIELTMMFPDDRAAEEWFADSRWPAGTCCTACGSLNVQERPTRKPQPYRCRDCRKDFSVKTGTLMQSSNLGYQKWAFAIYLFATNLKGVSSMKLHRDLKITQKSAWHMLHRIRENWNDRNDPLAGPVEIDETYIGGKRRNMSNAKRKQLTGRGPVGKTAVVGIKDRATNQVVATPMESVSKEAVNKLVESAVKPDAQAYTDDSKVYGDLPKRESVNHSVSEYVRGQAHTNGIESFWSMLKRGYIGTYHKLSPKHLDRYVQEFAGRHNIREQDTIDQLASIASGMNGKRLTYKQLTADNSLPSGARAA